MTETIEFPVMKGNARMARGAGEFEVPLFSEITPNLWMGCSPSEFPDQRELSHALTLSALFGGVEYEEEEVECSFLMDGDKPRFDRILNLYPWGKYKVPQGTIQHTVTMYDGEDISEEVDELAKLVKSWLGEGHKVLVHCQAGLNRSSLIVARTLMLYGWRAKDVIAFIREKRSPTCLCNDAFENHLLSLDEERP